MQVADSKLLRRGLAGRRASIDQPRGSGSGGDGGGGQSLEDMAGSRKQITTLEGIQRCARNHISLKTRRLLPLETHARIADHKEQGLFSLHLAVCLFQTPLPGTWV